MEKSKSGKRAIDYVDISFEVTDVVVTAKKIDFSTKINFVSSDGVEKGEMTKVFSNKRKRKDTQPIEKQAEKNIRKGIEEERKRQD